MKRLFAAKISFEQTVQQGDRTGERTLDMLVAPRRELWWDPKQPGQESLWGSWIELSEEFFGAITKSPVPVDTRALQALKNSPLALDIYFLGDLSQFRGLPQQPACFCPVALSGRSVRSRLYPPAIVPREISQSAAQR